MSHWYAVHCRPGKEKHAATVLQHTHEVPIYIPEVRPRTQDKEATLLFPCYIFARMNLQTVTQGQVRRMPGVVNLVCFDGFPQVVPDAIVEALHEHVETINERGGVLDHSFAVGDIVRFKRGPLRGLEGIFQGPLEPSERARILIDFMGNLNRVEVDTDILERAREPQPPEPKRRTRGRGRYINQKHAGNRTNHGTS